MSQHRRPTQKQRVLALLEIAGTRGVRTNEFLQDQLPRFSARILELRNEGYVIRNKPDPASANGRIYTLDRFSRLAPKPRPKPKPTPSLSDHLHREELWAVLNALDEVIALGSPTAMPRKAVLSARQKFREELDDTAIPLAERDRRAEEAADRGRFAA